MKRSLLYKILLTVFVAMVLVSWAGAMFDDDYATNVPSCQAPVFWTDHPVGSLPELAGLHPDVFSPLINASSAGYLEMHEKSPPPFAPPVF